MGSGTPHIRATERALSMLEAVVLDDGRSSIAALARGMGMPVSTAHRQVTTLVAGGYLAAAQRGGHVAGPRLLTLLHRLDEKQVLANVAAPLLDRLANELHAIVQLGTLENDMVTYRIKTGHGADDLFTKVGMQLEAYCSGIGKILLAHLSEDDRERYLANGPFVPLTSRTIVDPAELARELKRIGERGYATDNGEVAAGLICLAVPLHNIEGRTIAAISVSQAEAAPSRVPQSLVLPKLADVARSIERAAFGLQGLYQSECTSR